MTSRPVVPTEKDQEMSLEQRVAEAIGMCACGQCMEMLKPAIAVVRESIARDLEAERDKYRSGAHWWADATRSVLTLAIRIARNGAST